MTIRALIVFCVVFLVPVVMAESIAIIVHRNNVISELSIYELTSMFRARSRVWPDGQRVFVIQPQRGSVVHRRFDAIVLDPTTAESADKWDEALGARVLYVKDEQAAVRLVSQLSNSIGYVRESVADSTVKIVKIDDCLPSDSGYRLKD